MRRRSLALYFRSLSLSPSVLSNLSARDAVQPQKPAAATLAPIDSVEGIIRTSTIKPSSLTHAREVLWSPKCGDEKYKRTKRKTINPGAKAAHFQPLSTFLYSSLVCPQWVAIFTYIYKKDRRWGLRDVRIILRSYFPPRFFSLGDLHGHWLRNNTTYIYIYTTLDWKWNDLIHNLTTIFLLCCGERESESALCGG